MKRIFLTACACLFPFFALAQDVPPRPMIETKARQAIVLEVRTGAVLLDKNANERMPTSSMSKIMTMYLVFEALENNALTLDQKVKISKKAWEQKGSRMFLRHNQRVRIEDLIRGVVVQSGNDASVALAEAVAGTEAGFVNMMNDKARTLGLTGSHFANASGLPDPAHYSTARDLAVLSAALIRDFPQHYHYYAEKSFTFNKIKQGNRNPLLYRNLGVDGIKTGHTQEAGFGLVAAALRDGRRVISVVNGLKTMQERADESARMIDWAYREYDTYAFAKENEIVGQALVRFGVSSHVPVAAAHGLHMTMPRAQRQGVRVERLVAKETRAPIHKGDKIGKIVVIGPNVEPVEVPLVAAEDVPKVGLLGMALATIKRLIGKE